MKSGKYRVSFPLIFCDLDWYKVVDGNTGHNVIGGQKCLSFKIESRETGGERLLYSIPGINLHDVVFYQFDGSYGGWVYLENHLLSDFWLKLVEE